MSQPSSELRFEVASALNRGRRDYQEDAIIADFPVGTDFGFTVLADGMGGHASGDVASKIVLTEVFSELKLQSGAILEAEETLPEVLRNAAYSANKCVEAHAHANPDSRGMGSTLVAPVLVRDHLYWVSVGDSPLYLFRDGALCQINEDHSMAPQIDLLAENGVMTEESAKSHPDRNCLTSVLIGSEISHIDCPGDPVKLIAGDIVLVASDGLQFLPNDRIEQILTNFSHLSSSQLADALMQNLEDLDDPDQDNISFAVIRVSAALPGYKTSDLTEGAGFRTTKEESADPVPAGNIAATRHSATGVFRRLYSKPDTNGGTF